MISTDIFQRVNIRGRVSAPVAGSRGHGRRRPSAGRQVPETATGGGHDETLETVGVQRSAEGCPQ